MDLCPAGHGGVDEEGLGRRSGVRRAARAGGHRLRALFCADHRPRAPCTGPRLRPAQAADRHPGAAAADAGPGGHPGRAAVGRDPVRAACALAVRRSQRPRPDPALCPTATATDRHRVARRTVTAAVPHSPVRYVDQTLVYDSAASARSAFDQVRRVVEACAVAGPSRVAGATALPVDPSYAATFSTVRAGATTQVLLVAQQRGDVLDVLTLTSPGRSPRGSSTCCCARRLRPGRGWPGCRWPARAC